VIENQMEVGGAVVFWALAEWSDRDRLKSALEAVGLGQFLPPPRPASAALRSALEEALAGPRVLIRPLAKRDGFAVVREQRGERGNAYLQELLAHLDNASNNGHGSNGNASSNSPPAVLLEPEDERAGRVRESYRKQLGLLHSGQVGACLVEVIGSLGGIRLRPNGAVYWLPGHKVDDFVPAARAVEGAGLERPGAVYLVRHRLDADAVRAVRDAIVTEVQAEAGRIHDEVVAGELGSRALEARRSQASELRKKVLLYEDLLHLGLEGLHLAVDQADQAAAAAVLLASARPAEEASANAG
jgi:hypothetical protein